MFQRLFQAIQSLRSRKGVLFFAWISIFVFVCALLVIIVAKSLPKCTSTSMPCILGQTGGCLCSIRSYDGSCWLRTTSLMKCYTTTIVVPSGTCQGSYTTRLCGESQNSITSLTSEIASAYNLLQANKTDICYPSYSNENSRCSLPSVQYSPRPFVAEQCCRPPVQTCASDLDCCDCGYESSQCKAPLKCIVTKSTATGVTEESTFCQYGEDACISFVLPGCGGDPTSCSSAALDQPIESGQDSSCCADGTCKCTTKCQHKALVTGCPCKTVAGGCRKKMCAQSSNFFSFGGIDRYLKSVGATDIMGCYSDNCNQPSWRDQIMNN
uniref:Uncharacterized protein n=2 Tax=Guillardia theta TaxID=55529 RepID=A0A7S4NVI8_GUITH|mmetsp:Transcript_35875/g.112209  ORF Transcript_35875/g.112209 Transcript_35875/m.112209 type:complete len:325 (+) Transcript_35875:413-1387(+)